jgi:predicted nucleic acid-binding protein
VKFADTRWWVAWAAVRDQRHDQALAMLRHVGATEQIVTTDLVVGETWTFLARTAGHASAVAFIDRIDDLMSRSKVVVHSVTAEQARAAWVWLRKHDERVYSYVDATSFRVMHDRRVREALAFESDFAAAGFVEVGAS